MSLGGALLDATSIDLSPGAGSQSHAAGAWDGAAWRVAWLDDRLGSGHVFSTRVAPDGGLLEPAGLQVSTTPVVGVPRAVALREPGCAACPLSASRGCAAAVLLRLCG